MFRRGRGRPLLATAVVVGASRSAARHEVASQNQQATQQQQARDVEAEKKRREEDERALRTQLAIDDAIGKERTRSAQMMPVPAQPIYGPHPMKEGGGSHCFCGGCGVVRRREDRFCGGCGMQYRESGEVAFAGMNQGQMANEGVGPPEYLQNAQLI